MTKYFHVLVHTLSNLYSENIEFIDKNSWHNPPIHCGKTD